MKLFETIANFCTKNESKIELTAGIVLGITGAVLACKATLKVDEVANETKNTVERIHAAVDNAQTENGLVYTAEDAKSDISKLAVKTGLKVTKLYLPAIACGAAAIGLILRSYHVMDNKITELSSALMLTERAFNRYRNNVRIKYGEDVDRELAMNKFVKTETVNEDGSTTSEITKERSAEGYSIIFSPETSDKFIMNNDANVRFIQGTNEHFENLLNMGGKNRTVTLRDVYKYLGVYDKRSDALTDYQKKAGLVCGWVADGNPNYDQFVKFTVEEFVYDEEKGINAYWIDFNCASILDRV